MYTYNVVCVSPPLPNPMSPAQALRTGPVPTSATVALEARAPPPTPQPSAGGPKPIVIPVARQGASISR